MQRVTVQLVLLCLAVCTLFACAKKEKPSPVQSVTQVEQEIAVPPPLEFADPLQEEIDKLTREIAELEDSYLPISALCPVNSTDRLGNHSSSYTFENSRIYIQVTEKEMRRVVLILRQEEAREEANLAFLQDSRRLLKESKVEMEKMNTALLQAKKQLQEANIMIKEARKKYNLPE